MALSKKVIAEIRNLIQELKKENGITVDIVRDEVFNILQGMPHCTVVYYPIESEAVEDGCDGCHVERTIKGEKEQLVFINTANTRERQAFSVAHELGHIWKVDSRLKAKLPGEEFDSEEAIDRFAAELLMPQEEFWKLAEKKLQELQCEDHLIKTRDAMKVVVYLMDCFFTPYKATVIRLNEVEIFSEESKQKLLSYKGSQYVSDIIAAGQYTRLGIKTNNKGIANLQQNLIEIEERGLFTKNKIEEIRKEFDIKTEPAMQDIESVIAIK
ncbi:MAG: ImmA/IrrE family metallo-endopeptidase [Lachnospiraceae bacterium]